MANEVRLIDANAAIKAMNAVDIHFWEDAEDGVEKCVNILHNAPSVDAVEVVHGEWCEDYETFIDDSGKESYPIQTGYVCSECGKDGYPNWHYCPNCGAKNGRMV